MSKGSRPRPYSISQTTFANNYDAIFRKPDPRVRDDAACEDEAFSEIEKRNTMSPSVEQMKQGTCGCGRSPTGNCCGWHALTEEQYQHRKELYETGKADLQGREVK
jgi:hypothetical protein